MKRIFLLILITVEVGFVKAQPQSAYWYFGNKAGLHFLSNNIVECDTNSVMGAQAGSASISDDNGNLLFYTNGWRVWNKLGEYMLHGDSLFYQGELNWAYPPNYQWFTDNCESRSGTNILPIGNNKYYVVTANCMNYPPTPDSIFVGPGYYWFLVDMNLNGGMGDVVGLPHHYSFKADAPLGSVRHANGRDWWVLGQMSSDSINTIIEFLVTPYGIQDPFFLDAGQKPSGNPGTIWGEIIFSNNGSKMLRTSVMGITEIFDFNRCNGELSNVVDLSIDSTVTSQWTWEQFTPGCSLSPNGKIIYLNTLKYLIQMFSPTEDNNYIKDTIWANPFWTSGTCICPALEMQMLGPDGKIYISNGMQLQYPDTSSDPNTSHLSVINSPDSIGQACGFQPFSISTCERKLVWGLPYMPNWNLGPIDGSECDSLGIDNGIAVHKKNAEELKVYPNPAEDELTIEILRQAPDDYIGTSQHDINTIEIINALGVTVIKLKQTKPIQQLNIKSLAQGVYFIKVQMQNGDMQVRKFIKQ